MPNIKGAEMKTSTEIRTTANFVGYEKAIELIAKAGFDAWDFTLCDMARYNWNTKTYIAMQNEMTSPNYANFAKILRKVGENNGIRCNQSHAPFPVCCKEIKDYLKRAIECTAIAGGEICIVHPDNDKNGEENAQMYFELLEFAKPMGVKIACENMFNYDASTDTYLNAACSTAQSFLEHLNAVNDDYFVACLDVGHAEMRDLKTSAVDIINKIGGKIQALHLHDNDLKHDCHAMPFTMNIDYLPIIKALKKVGYNGYMTLEADSHLSKFTINELSRELKNLYNSARKLADMFENA